MEIHGKLVDIHNHTIEAATITITGPTITSIKPDSHRGKGFILPGFVDGNLLLESTLLPPTEFARMAVRHGTVATIHPLGQMDKTYMQNNARQTPFKFHLNTQEQDPTSERFASDILPPDQLQLGHINLLVKRSIQEGLDLFDALTLASKAPVEHFHLDIGLLREEDPADFIIVEDLKTFRVLETYINGQCVFRGETLLPKIDAPPLTSITAHHKTPALFAGELPSSNHLKVATLSRTNHSPPKISFIENFGLQEGAIGLTCGYNTQDILAFGTIDEDVCNVVNALIDAGGGIALSSERKTDVLPLPIAGYLSPLDGEELARLYSDLDEAAKIFGTPLKNFFSKIV